MEILEGGGSTVALKSKEIDAKLLYTWSMKSHNREDTRDRHIEGGDIWDVFRNATTYSTKGSKSTSATPTSTSSPGPSHAGEIVGGVVGGILFLLSSAFSAAGCSCAGDRKLGFRNPEDIDGKSAT